VSEAFPYLSRRLLTDDSPRAKAALRSMLYGSEGRDSSNAAPSFTQLLSMGEGFASYSSATSAVPEAAAAATATTSTTSTLSAPAPAAAASAPATAASASAASASASAAATSSAAAAAGAPASSGAGDELVDVLLSADGNYVQELLLEEAAKLADAAVRDSLGKMGASSLAANLAEALQTPKRLGGQVLGALPLPGGVRDGLLLPATVLDPHPHPHPHPPNPHPHPNPPNPHPHPPNPNPKLNQVLDDLSRLVPTLSRTELTDEQSLAAFGELWDKLAPPQTDEAGAAAVGLGGAAGGAAAGGAAGGAGPFGLQLPPLPSLPSLPSLALPPPLQSGLQVTLSEAP